MSEHKEKPGCYFVTGYPGFIGKRLVEHIAKSDPKGRIYLLVQPKFYKDAKRWIDRNNTQLSDVQAEGDPNRKTRPRFLLGIWRDEGRD